MRKVTRICLWSGPRNISTALMYSFAQRNDTMVFDEPLYGYYLTNSQANEYHPGASQIVESMECDGEKVIANMLNESRKPVLFFKNMTHHLLDIDKAFMKDMVNVILTRDPVEMIPSFAKVINHPTIYDIGYAQNSELLDYLEKNKIEPVVLDSKRILLNPKGVLKQLCLKANITFDEKMLQWKSGAKAEDGVWAKYWYDSVHKSKGFSKYIKKEEPFPNHLEPLLKECMPHYEKLLPYAIA